MKRNIFIILGFLLFDGSVYLGYKFGKIEGVKAYHNQCLIGGIIVNEEQGTIVHCKPLPAMPKQELKNFL